MALLLAHEELSGILSPDEVIAAVRGGFEEQARGQVQCPPRITIDSTSGQGWLRVMPTILNGSGIMGYKAMHSTPKVGVRYLVMLYDLKTGELLAAMDADWLTSQRTAATAAVGVDLLARKSVHEVGVLGSSEQARSMLVSVSRVRKLPKVKVYSPTPENRRRFAETMSEAIGAPITPVDTPQQALAGCDLVVSMFRSGREPVVPPDWVAPGAHLIAASSVRPDNRELEDGVWRKCSVVAVDDREHAFESGDGRSALASGATRKADSVELWELVGGTRPGRQKDEDITLFKAVGTGMQDLALAIRMYRRAKERGLGRDLGDFPHVR